MAIDYVLTPGADGRQRSWDPDGEEGGDVDLPIPQSVTAESTGENSIRVNWEMPTGIGDADGFILEFTPLSNINWEEVARPSSWVRTYQVGGLASGTTYGFRLRTYLGTDTSATSNSAWTQTDDTETPPPGEGDTDLDRMQFYENFESGFHGQNVKNVNSYLVNVNRGTVDTSQAYPGGTRSMKSEVRAGTSGWGDWGFVLEHRDIFPRNMRQNAEIWFRVAWRTPSNWVNQSAPSLKMLRVGKTAANGSNRGWNDAYLHPSNDRMRFIAEYDSDPPDHWHTPLGPTIVNERWYMFEVYWYMHSVPRDKGGLGVMKFWQDGRLVTDYGGFGTMGLDLNHAMDRGVVMNTIWNWWVGDNPSISPRTQHNWLDHPTVALRVPSHGIDQTPWMDRDETGFPFIGLAIKGGSSGG